MKPAFTRLSVFAALAVSSAAALAQSSTAVVANPSSVAQGQSTTLTATVTYATQQPYGTVDFYVDNTNVSSQALTGATSTTATASYTLSTSSLSVGPHSVYAYFEGGGYTVPPSTSPQINVTVTAAAKGSTTTSLTAPSSVKAGSNGTLTATVTGTSGHAPTGTVSFYIAGNLIASANVSNGTASVTGSAAGVADGTYQLTAKYNGDTYNSPSTSSPKTVTINGTTKTTLSISPSPVTIGESATLTAKVTGDTTAPTGTVKFTVNGTQIGSAPVSNGSASISASSAGLPAGTYTVVATYSGDSANDASSGSASATLTTQPSKFAVAPAGAAIATGGTAQFSISPAPAVAVTWSVDGIAGGNSTVGTISSTGLYTAPGGTQSGSVTVTASEAGNPNGATNSATVYVVVPGKVGSSNSTQVASYSINAPTGGQFSVEFGPTTSYGRATWAQPTTGASQNMLVAGMSAPATYHMRADITFPGNVVYHDADMTFATTPVVVASNFNPTPSVTATPGLSPEPGMELMSLIEFSSPYVGAAVGYDMSGNNIYTLPTPPDAAAGEYWNPIQLLPNGHWLGTVSGLAQGANVPPTQTSAVYELLLDGTIVHELTLAQLQANLQASGYKDGTGVVPTLAQIHHDLVVNPNNGHWIMLTNADRTYQSVEGETCPCTALGDIVIDVDPANNFAVTWVWNEFDHLDINRHPFMWPDWTHSNAVVYVPGDHNILVSSRHQNWVMKVNYQDGTGDGTLMWRFGYQGDFTLENGVDPTDWQYAQHSPAFTTAGTSGVFGLTLMDNGDDRQFASGVTCSNTGGTPPCYYSRAPIFTVDEYAMTVRLDSVMPNENYSFFGGNADQLDNGDEHVDFCYAVQSSTVTGSVVDEYTPGENPALVWELKMPNTYSAYRSHRLGSLYPGVVWTK